MDQLVRAGGWTLFVTLVAVIGVGALRRWWVPGWLWVQERADRLRSDLQANVTVRAIARLAREVSRLAKAVSSADEQLATILGEVRALRSEVADMRRAQRDDRGDRRRDA